MKDKPLRAILIKRPSKANKLTIEDTTFLDKIDVLYNLLECDTIDIQERYINNIAYDFIIDDEYLLNGKSQEPSNCVAIGTRNGEILEIIFGNFIICHTDGNGNETDINDEDITNVKKSLQLASHNNKDFYTIINYTFEPEYKPKAN